MKTLLAFLFASALLASGSLHAADFEGIVKMKMTGPRGTPSDMTFSLTKGHSRIDMKTAEAGSPTMLFDQSKQEMIVLMPEQKMYLVRPLSKADEAQVNGASDDATVEKTNETEKILGYDCVKYISKAREGVTEIWVTDKLGTFMGLGGGNPMGGPGGRRGRGAMPESWANALRGQEAFPLRVITKDASGKESFRMEATAVENTSLPASTFTPPADFQKFDMEGMMRGMGMPGGRPPGGG